MQDVPPGKRSNRDALPQIVLIVLRQAGRLRCDGHLTQSDFEEKLARLEAEELAPNGFELLVRDMANGTTRFLVRESRTGRVREMIDCGQKHSSATGSPPRERAERHAAMAPSLAGCKAAG